MRVITIIMMMCSVSFAEFSNGISAGVFAGAKGDENTVQYDQGNDSNGREYKAGEASNQGNTGQTMAYVVGGVLTGTGTALLMSPFIWDQIAGADLIAKGAMEFAQAAADGSSSKNNSDQRDMLTNNYTTFDGQKQTPQLNNPELDKLLAQRGIDANDFKQRLLNGSLNSREAVMNALGMDNNFSQEDLERGQRLSNNKFASLFGMGMSADGHEPTESSTETSRFESDPSTSVTSSSAALNDPTQSSTFPATTADSTILPTTAARALVPHEAGEAGEGSIDVSVPNLSGFLKGMMGGAGKAMANSGLAQMSRSALESLGIKKRLKKQSIFEISQKTYRNFGRWRVGTGRMAKN